MNPTESPDTIALLLSGGLDSSILLAHLLSSGRTIRPIYIRTQVAWQDHELRSINRYLRACKGPRLLDLVTLALPLDDLYTNHWSITGRDAPGADTPDEAVYLPGRNPLLLIKAAVWCQMQGIRELALATLANNPFADATDQFFSEFERVLSRALSAQTRVLRPFADQTKQDVMRLARNFPLEHTFSCIAPVDGIHCGRCNKCAERSAAFLSVDMPDPTPYASKSRPARRRVHS
jgi:7-cyano-7-deazaguanine synthase